MSEISNEYLSEKSKLLVKNRIDKKYIDKRERKKRRKLKKWISAWEKLINKKKWLEHKNARQNHENEKKAIYKEVRENLYWKKFLEKKEKLQKNNLSKNESNEKYDIIKISVTWYFSSDNSKDWKMQWRWLMTASWVKPKLWMIAAPSNWDFWTKLILPDEIKNIVWYDGEFTCEDRWSAIKNNKIDVYCWEWETGRKKAMELWNRIVEAKIPKAEHLKIADNKKSTKEDKI